MKRTKLVIIGLMLALFAAGAAYAQPESKYQQNRDEQRERVFKELNLTPEQQKRLEDNRKVQRQEVDKLFTALRDKQEKLQEILKSPAVNKATVTPIANEIKALQAQLVDHRINGILTVKGILTPEQFVKFQKMIQEHKEGRMERFEQWRERKKHLEPGNESCNKENVVK